MAGGNATKLPSRQASRRHADMLRMHDELYDRNTDLGRGPVGRQQGVPDG